MAITHIFVSTIGDGSDATLLRPSNWNADHTIATGTITEAQLATAAAAKLVTNGDSHDHLGGDGAQIAYSSLGSPPSIPVKATGAEVDTGTDDAKFITPLAFAGSKQHLLINASTADQQVSATTAYLTGSNLAIPAGKLRVGSVFKWACVASKTGAGTAACTFIVKVGTLGTTGDTSFCSMAMPVGTAAIDSARFDILCTCRGPLSSSGKFQANLALRHNLHITGFSTIGVNVSTLSGVYDVTVANLIIGLAVTTAASTVWTFQQVIAEALNV